MNRGFISDNSVFETLVCWFRSITLAASPGHLPNFKMLMLFGCGALLLRGAGCTVNDLLDRDIDTMVSFFFISTPLRKCNRLIFLLRSDALLLAKVCLNVFACL